MSKEPYILQLPVRSRVDPSIELTIKHPIFLPHEMLAAVSNAGPTIIEKALLGPAGIEAVAAFWRSPAAAVTGLNTHPARAAGESELAWTLPLELFGDDATIWHREKLLVICFGSALRPSSTFWNHFLIAVLPVALLIPGKTLNVLHSAIVWSFEALLTGSWPRRDHTGKLLRKHHGRRRFIRRGEKLIFRGALVSITGDYKYHVETYRIRSYANTECCHRCQASKTDPNLLYTATGPDAPWRQHPRTHEMYTQEMGGNMPTLCLIPGWHLNLVRTDLMHNLMLGTALHVIASAIVQLANEKWFGPGRATASRLQEAYSRFMQWRKDNNVNCCIPRFTAARLGWSRGKFPEYQSKAHNARVVLAWLQQEASKAAEREGAGTRSCMRAHMLERVAMYCYLLDTLPKDRPLTQNQADSLADCGSEFVASYLWMARDALANRQTLYAAKPKLHQPAPQLPIELCLTCA